MMDRIVGRYVLIVVASLQTVFLQADITLRVRDHQNRSIERIAVGYPFVVEVTLDGEQGTLRNPVINQLDRFTQVGRETKIYTINGKARVTYLYTLTAREPGAYKIGPAHIKHKGKTVTSKLLSLTVVDGADQDDETSVDAEPIIVRLGSNKKRVVVGECVCCSLQLFFCDDSVEVQTVAQPTWEHCRVQGPGDPHRRTEIIDGVSYQCIEWVWHVYPEKIGSLFVPASAIDFKVPFDEKDDPLARFSFFFRQNYKNKRVYSNPLTIQVDPLPPYNGQVNGIGIFSSFNAELKPSIAKEGEGMILTLSVQHSYDSALLQEPVLSGVPDNVRVYDSKRYSVDQKNGFQVDYIEYVVQGIKPGSAEIPSQTFTYFDVRSHTYKTIRSSSIDITILAAAARPQPQIARKSEQDQTIATVDDVTQEIKPLWSDIQESACSDREIPVWLFLLALGMPIIIFCVGRLKGWFNKVRERALGNHQKRAFARARHALLLAKKNGSYAALYPLFMQLFSDRFAIQKADISAHEIAQLLARSGLPEHDLLAWNRFFSYLSELVFYQKVSHDTDEYERDRLFERAYDWLSILEKYL